ncbi:hypothetical protein L3556_05920 [Candidatus Synechococcus calcipolaris G9]|uniref:Uncharacterized protein n=1 Tax=Candidatus Synechococcus calcipolaris G9 TaxID=1497997 RepID=A0ABT6EYS0_9SYNE|nr:hypothetical protein [Candidatus Synechococcus calcipolaris]MDG2990471.1 hypothetical protein [Candidatus Synechococcus calcipolaris G9]
MLVLLLALLSLISIKIVEITVHLPLDFFRWIHIPGLVTWIGLLILLTWLMAP